MWSLRQISLVLTLISFVSTDDREFPAFSSLGSSHPFQYSDSQPSSFLALAESPALDAAVAEARGKV